MSNSDSGIYLFIYSPVWLVHRHSSILEIQNSPSPFLLALQQPADVGNRETAFYTNVLYARLTRGGGGRERFEKKFKNKRHCGNRLCTAVSARECVLSWCDCVYSNRNAKTSQIRLFHTTRIKI